MANGVFKLKWRALLVMESARQRLLASHLQPLGFGVTPAEDCFGARRFFSRRLPVHLVVSDVTLPDGNWSDVLRCLIGSGARAAMLVSSPAASETLRLEALSRGVGGLLVEPYDSAAVRRALREATAAAHSAERRIVPFPSRRFYMSNHREFAR